VALGHGCLMKNDILGPMTKNILGLPCLFWVCLLCDTHGVVALADQGLPVVVPLGPDRDQLQGVGSGAELPVDRLHPPAGAVSQVYAAHWVLVTEK